MVILNEFAECAFLLKFLYVQSSNSAYFEDLCDPINSFEDLLDEKIRRPVFLFQTTKLVTLP